VIRVVLPQHLQTLARISFVLQDSTLRRFLEKRATPEAILERLAELRPAGEGTRRVARPRPNGVA